MNNSHGGDLVVFEVKSQEYLGLKQGQLGILWSNTRRFFEEPTAFLADRYCASGRRSSPSTWKSAAFSLVSWFQFLQALGRDDWREASLDDLQAYRDIFSQGISPKTGANYVNGTIANRMIVILRFYEYSAEQGWYRGDIIKGGLLDEIRSISLDSNPLAHTQKGRPAIRISRAAREFVPRRQNSSKIRPFLPGEMRAFLQALGPRASERGDDTRPSRDRLLADLGWAVGLRLDEIHQLTKYQFLSLSPDADAPANHQTLIVRGKGSQGSGKKARPVAIPNWLIADALAYIDTERAAALKKKALEAEQRHRL